MEIPIEVVDAVKNLGLPSIIAISGFGGAGKSTFSDLLGEMTNIPVIRLDS